MKLLICRLKRASQVQLYRPVYDTFVFRTEQKFLLYEFLPAMIYHVSLAPFQRHSISKRNMLRYKRVKIKMARRTRRIRLVRIVLVCNSIDITREKSTRITYTYRRMRHPRNAANKMLDIGTQITEET